jgi:hypothetical protein
MEVAAAEAAKAAPEAAKAQRAGAAEEVVAQLASEEVVATSEAPKAKLAVEGEGAAAVEAAEVEAANAQQVAAAHSPASSAAAESPDSPTLSASQDGLYNVQVVELKQMAIAELIAAGLDASCVDEVDSAENTRATLFELLRLLRLRTLPATWGYDDTYCGHEVCGGRLFDVQDPLCRRCSNAEVAPFRHYHGVCSGCDAGGGTHFYIGDGGDVDESATAGAHRSALAMAMTGDAAAGAAGTVAMNTAPACMDGAVTQVSSGTRMKPRIVTGSPFPRIMDSLVLGVRWHVSHYVVTSVGLNVSRAEGIRKESSFYVFCHLFSEL